MNTNRRAERDALYEDYLRRHGSGDPKLVSYEDLVAAARGYQVTIVGGYSGLGYEEPEAVRRRIGEIVGSKGDRSFYVLGGTKDGIGEAYAWIREEGSSRGFRDVKTAGIVSREAARRPESIAEQDYLVFVDTEVGEWRVQRDGASLMVDMAKRTGGELVYFQGGAISGAEIREALERGVRVTIYASPDIRPNQERVAKKRQTEPGQVADATEAIVSRYERSPHPLLTIVR